MMNFVRRFLCSLQQERVIKQKCTFSSSCWFLPFLFPLLFLSCLLTLPNINHCRFTSFNSKMAIWTRSWQPLLSSIHFHLKTAWNKIPYAHHYNPGMYIFEDHFFVFKEVFSENLALMYGC